MTVAPAAAARLRQFGYPFAAAWLAGVILLLLAPRWEYPTRNLPAELRAWSLGLPLLLLVVTFHVRRRQPQMVVAAQRLALGLAVLRLAALLVFTAVSVRLNPENLGHTSDDGHIGSLVVRSVLLYTGGEDTSWQYSTIVYGYGLFLLQGPADETPRPKPVWLWMHGILCRLIGFSVVAVALPLALVNVFFVVQIWLLLRPLVHPATHFLVTAWLIISPDQALVAAGFHKDFASGIGLLYVLEYASRGRVPQPRLRLWQAALVVFWMGAFRADTWPLPIGLFVWLWLLPRLPPAALRPVSVVVVLLALGAGAVVGSGAIGQTEAEAMWRTNFLGNFAFSLLASPLLYASAFGLHRNPFLYTMCDLPVSLFWPLVAALLIVAVLLAPHRRPALGAGAVWVIFGWQLAIASSGLGLLHRFRLPLDPLLLAFALETARQIGRLQPARRAWLLSFAVSVATVIYLVQIAPLLFKIADYPVLS
ncbi:MAG: hypothetical protein IT204_12670 [Fimbriimonadaceae bacterium]|nr:hypothetical protein [Fimbriimonadaceae bacterium]